MNVVFVKILPDGPLVQKYEPLVQKYEPLVSNYFSDGVFTHRLFALFQFGLETAERAYNCDIGLLI